MNKDNAPIPVRENKDYKGLSRIKIFNHFNTEYKKGEPGNRLSDFLAKGFLSWIKHTVKSGFGKKHAYLPYPAGQTGIHKMKRSAGSQVEEVVIAIASDWATFTPESFAVADKIGGHNPDYTIHMGDTYYVGALPEILSNFFPLESSPWVRGNVGSFALLGNHEMYTRGVAFFDTLLDSLGTKNPNGEFSGQKAGFFCLENDHWLILGLDTGYNSLRRPPFGWIPGFAGNCQFDPILMEWLEKTVFIDPRRKNKGLLILTHHQYITAFKEKEYQKPAEQLATFINAKRPVIWLWGHEHKFTLFEKTKVEGGVTAYGRCIGHGGMPVELNNNMNFDRSAFKKGTDKLVMADTRPYPNKDNLKLGFNGYAVLKLKENDLTIEYHDINRFLLKETWQVDSQGNIKGSISEASGSGLNPEPGKSWNDAVK